MFENAALGPSCRASKKVQDRDLKQLHMIDFCSCSTLDSALNDLPPQISLGSHSSGLLLRGSGSYLKAPHSVIAKVSCVYAPTRVYAYSDIKF